MTLQQVGLTLGFKQDGQNQYIHVNISCSDITPKNRLKNDILIKSENSRTLELLVIMKKNPKNKTIACIMFISSCGKRIRNISLYLYQF